MKKRIMIDPGHGGDKDNGAVYGFVEEDDTNLAIGYLLRCELQRKGHTVIMTRVKDEEVLLSDRTIFANEMQVDLFVSIHCDAYHKDTAQGMTVHVSLNGSKTSRKVAYNIQEALSDRFPKHRNRGMKESNFQVLRETKMPAVLVECEFLSNEETRKFLHEPENQLALARAIATGINESYKEG